MPFYLHFSRNKHLLHHHQNGIFYSKLSPCKCLAEEEEKKIQRVNVVPIKFNRSNTSWQTKTRYCRRAKREPRAVPIPLCLTNNECVRRKKELSRRQRNDAINEMKSHAKGRQLANALDIHDTHAHVEWVITTLSACVRPARVLAHWRTMSMCDVDAVVAVVLYLRCGDPCIWMEKRTWCSRRTTTRRMRSGCAGIARIYPTDAFFVP